MPQSTLHKLLWLLFLLIFSSLSSAAIKKLPALQTLATAGVKVSGLVVDLPSGRVLAKINPHTRLIPASLTKLYTAAASLEAWGPNKTFTTQILANTLPHNGVLKGNLVFLGGGDATLTYSGLWLLATQLKEAGINRIKGNLVINRSLFGKVACQSNDRCEAKSSSRFAYDSPLSSAGINFGTWCLAVSPGHIGMRAHVRLCQLRVPGITLVGHIKTIAAGQKNVIKVTRVRKKNHDQLRLSGKIAANSPTQHIYRSVTNAPMQTGRIFRELLRRSGIRITGKIRITSKPIANNLVSLAQISSITLGEQLRRMMTYSNNYMADTLALDLLAEDPNAIRPLTLETAGKKLQALALHISSTRTSLTRKALAIHSGSGLTPDNALSAADIVALLKTMYLRTALFPAFIGSLTVPKFSPLTIFHGNKPGWRTRISAKTGSLQVPVTVLGLAGYFRKRDGNWGAFALLINGGNKHPHIPFQKGTGALRHDINWILKKY